MERITLRSYHGEIETLIENSNYEDAIAHCRHILKTFPKNVDTYRLLGKAYLESQRYNEAVDIFQRVLSVFPDDFLAHLGLSIIKEEQGNLDASIWHLERAYEIQPSNPALQAELKRLHGRRDGIEPPKVRLTRSALARMYQRGQLYPQALAEIQTGINEEPSRVDLEVLHAELLSQSGKDLEAFQLASRLINKMPYCYTANKIIANSTSQTSDAQLLNKANEKLNEIDPYLSLPTPDEETGADYENLVSLDKLEIVSTSKQDIDMQNEAATTEYSAETDSDTVSEAEAQETDLAQESHGTVSEIPVIGTLGDQNETAAQSDTLDVEEVTDEERKKVISKMMDDLSDLDGELDPSLEDTVKIILKPDVEQADIIDEELVAEITSTEPELPTEPEDLSDLAESSPETDLHPDNDLPAWLSGLDSQTKQDKPFRVKNEIPEWLFGIDESLSESDAHLVNETEQSVPDTSDIDQAIAWLEGLAEKQGVMETTLLLTADERIYHTPEWISRLKNILSEEEKIESNAASEKFVEDSLEVKVEASDSESEMVVVDGLKLDSEDTVSDDAGIDVVRPGEDLEDMTQLDGSIISDVIPDTSEIVAEPEIAGEITAPGEFVDLPQLINNIESPVTIEETTSEIIQEKTNLESSVPIPESDLDSSISTNEEAVSQVDGFESINISQLSPDKHSFSLDQVINRMEEDQAVGPSPSESETDLSSALEGTVEDEISGVIHEAESSDEITSQDLESNDAGLTDTYGVEPHTTDIEANEDDSAAGNDDLNALKQISAENPDNIDTLRKLAKAYTRSGKFDEAKAIYKQIEKILRQ